MGFKSYIESYNYEDPSQFIKEIKRDCKPYLKSGATLYRGMSEKPPFGYRITRKDRKPRDSSKEFQMWIEKYADENNLPKRSESMFATKDLTTARDYGDLYYVFPKGNYRVLVYPDIPDMYLYMFMMKLPKDADKMSFDELNEYLYKNLEGIDKQQHFRLADRIEDYTLYKAGQKIPLELYREHEFTIECEGYYYISEQFTIQLAEEGIIKRT